MEIGYGALAEEGERLAEAVGGRCLVFCLCENSAGSLLGYVSFLNHGIVPLLLDAGLDRGLLASLAGLYRPDYVWAPESVIGEFDDRLRKASVGGNAPEGAVVSSVGLSSLERVYAARGYVLLKTPYRRAFPLNDALALLLTTSGSTGSPKFVRQSYENIRSNTESIVEFLEIGRGERAITTLPMSYTYGLSILNTHLYAGASVVLTRQPLMQKGFWQQFARYGATSFGGVPYVYEMLDKLRFYRMELPTLRTMTQAGGRLPPELHQRFAEHAARTGRKFVVMYGQTEATARMSWLPPAASLAKVGSVGGAIPGGAFSLVDADGREVGGAGEVGELVYRGSNVALGYAERGEDLALGDEFGGVLATGDMARRDEDGYYFIVGRKKRFLKIFGNRVNLDEVEALLRGAFPGADCACAGVDDRLTVYCAAGCAGDSGGSGAGDSGGADAGKSGGSGAGDSGGADAGSGGERAQQPSAGDICAFLAGVTGLNRAAFHVVAVTGIPRGGSGKILYTELERLAV